MSDLKQQAHKQLSKQTSDQLKKKLADNKLMGVSKEVAIEILTKRGVELPAGVKADSSAASPAKAAPTKEKEKAGEKKKASPKKSAAGGARKSKHNDADFTFKKDTAVKFKPYRSNAEKSGTVIGGYFYKKKGTNEKLEGVIIEDKAGERYRKNVEHVHKA